MELRKDSEEETNKRKEIITNLEHFRYSKKSKSNIPVNRTFTAGSLVFSNLIFIIAYRARSILRKFEYFGELYNDNTRALKLLKQRYQISNFERKPGSSKKIIDKLISEETYKHLSDTYDNINVLVESPINDCLEIENEFIEYYQSRIIGSLKICKLLDESLKVSLNCLYLSFNVISKYIENHEVSTTINDVCFMKVFDGFFDMISSHYLAERICESILYAMCSLMKLENKEINYEFWKNKLELCFRDDKISEENKLASSVILTQLDISNVELMYNIDGYLDKIYFDGSDNYFGFTKSEIVLARNRVTKLLKKTINIANDHIPKKINDFTNDSDQIDVIETKVI